MVSLRKMTGEEFTAFLEVSIPEYATEKARAGSWKAEEALEKALSDKSSTVTQLWVPGEKASLLGVETTEENSAGALGGLFEKVPSGSDN